MKSAIYNLLKDDHDFISLYKAHNNESTRGYKALLKREIYFFISDFDIYLDKPYLDVSYMVYNGRYIDLDLLHDIFKNTLKENERGTE